MSAFSRYYCTNLMTLSLSGKVNKDVQLILGRPSGPRKRLRKVDGHILNQQKSPVVPYFVYLLIEVGKQCERTKATKFTRSQSRQSRQTSNDLENNVSVRKCQFLLVGVFCCRSFRSINKRRRSYTWSKQGLDVRIRLCRIDSVLSLTTVRSP